MALVMGKADVGYSSAGMRELVAELKKEYNAAAAIANTSSVEFRALNTALSNNWRGTDCDNFLTDLRKAATALEQDIKSCATALEKKLTIYETNVENLQKSTYKSNSVKIK